VRPFRYHRATDVAGAVAAVAAEPRAAFLAGGTNLVDLMKLGVEAPDLLVDVNHLALDRIERLEPAGLVAGDAAAGTATGGPGLRIGAGVRNSDLAADRVVRTRYPALAQALVAGASGQLRNVASVGGNLLQRSRCLYFQDVTKPCNKRVAGSGCPAREGEHRNLAILGAGEGCIATHPSDMAVALAAFDAVVHVTDPGGTRTIPLDDLYPPAGADPRRDTTLGHGALVTAVELPPHGFGRWSAYRKVRDRASFAFAVVSVAAALDVDDGVVRDVRLAFGAVAPRPWRARAAEDALRGRPATEEEFRRAADVELAAAAPLRDNAFKVPLVRNVAARTLAELADAADVAGLVDLP
jgi:xanthine dehydrogenase YagS FAD-binding subunit